MKRLLRSDMDFEPEQIMKILNQRGMVQQTSAGLPRYQQIEIAVFICRTTRDGAKYPQIARAMPLRQPADLLTPFLSQRAQRYHYPIIRQRKTRGTPTPDLTGITAA